jgi:hypothetical protein
MAWKLIQGTLTTATQMWCTHVFWSVLGQTCPQVGWKVLPLVCPEKEIQTLLSSRDVSHTQLSPPSSISFYSATCGLASGFQSIPRKTHWSYEQMGSVCSLWSARPSLNMNSLQYLLSVFLQLLQARMPRQLLTELGNMDSRTVTS